MRMSLLLRAAFLLPAATVLLGGCSSSFAPSSDTSQISLGAVTGIVHGGQQPIAGAHIYAYQSSTTAYGGASTSLIGTASVSGYPSTPDGTGKYYVSTDANGAFQISAATTCTQGTVVYLYSVGGDPGNTGNSNASAGLLTALGVCGDGVLADSVTTRVFMNEVGTVAAAYALAGFAVDATHIGAPTTAVVGGPVTDTLAQTGIQNAVRNASQLYNFAPGAGSSQSANATTPVGSGTVPMNLIDAVANILAACVNSTDPGYTNGTGACATLKSNATSTGVSPGTQPGDTATAAINIAHHPTANVTALFNIPSSKTNPFTTNLTAAPNDFSVSIVYTGGGLGTSGQVAPHQLAIDGAGNIWKTNYGTSAATSSLSQFTPLGVAVSGSLYAGDGSPFTGNGLNRPTSVAIDNSGNAWVANFNGNTVSKFQSSGAAVGSYNGGGGFSGPIDAEIDASGDVYVANNATDGSTNSIVELSSVGGVLKTSSGSDLNQAYSLAFENGTNGFWVVNESGNQYITHFGDTGANNDVATYGYQAEHVNYGVSVDSSGKAWVADAATSVCAVTTSTHLCYSIKGSESGTPAPIGTAVDGAGAIWVSDNANGTIVELSSLGALLSGGYGFPAVGNAPATSGASTPVAPNAIAVDGSGNVWYTTTSDSTLRVLIGIATPVATPLAYGVTSSLVGAKP